MSMIRYNPSDYTPVAFSSLLDKFFNDSMTKSGMSSFVPKVDVIEDEKAFELHVEVPGMEKEDFKIELNDGSLTVSGERKFKSEQNEKNFHSVETRYGSFSRTFVIPDNVEANKIDAKYKNGILELTLPKDEKKALKTSIKVS
ncbi:MAG: Hsp20/alpha crystallin family protein [Cyclobacteriaceae bacterium]